MKKETRKNNKNKKKSTSRTDIRKEKEKELKKKKTRKKLFRVFILLLFFVFIAFVIWALLSIPIASVVIKGNEYLTDQEIIDMAGIREYPSTLKTPSKTLQNKLEKSDYILTAKVSKKNFLTTVVIEVEENKPLFYYETTGEVILSDGTGVSGSYSVPTVINQIPDTVFEKFLAKMSGVPNDVLRKISEIRYYPNDVDTELFLMTMNDGNYVYVNISKFERLYNYLEYVAGFDDNKGILHLDSGDYLEILE